VAPLEGGGELAGGKEEVGTVASAAVLRASAAARLRSAADGFESRRFGRSGDGALASAARQSNTVWARSTST
jgi:hypothetical protein